MQNEASEHWLLVREREVKSSLDGPCGSRRHLPSNHPDTCDHFAHMGLTMTHQGRLSDAANFLSRAWEGRKVTLGESHPLTLRSLREFAEVQKRCGSPEASQKLLHDNDCHGYHTRSPTFSRQHAASMNSLDCLKATDRMSSLDSKLATSMSTGSIATFLKKGQMLQRRRPVMLANVESDSPYRKGRRRSDAEAHRKGRRMSDAEAESELLKFSAALFNKYESVEGAFKAFDINGNGTLSGSEFNHYAKYLYNGDCVAVFKALDGDRGGDISIEEFKFLKKLWKKHRSGNDDSKLTSRPHTTPPCSSGDWHRTQVEKDRKFEA